MELWGIRFSSILGEGAARRHVTGCIVAVAALGLAGCSGQPAPPPTQTTEQTAAQPAATHTPMFASDEEALAAGVDLYQRVLDAEVKYVNGDPGSEDEYRGLVVNEKWSSFQESSNKLKDSGAKFNGRMTADPIRLQQLRQGTDGVKMTFYACLDLSQAKVIDANGAPLEPKSINKRGYMVVDAETQDGTLRLSSVKQWSQDSC